MKQTDIEERAGMPQFVTVAAAQIDPKLFDKDANLRKIERYSLSARDLGAELVVFPEASVTGYCFRSLDEALPYVEPIPGADAKALAAMARAARLHMVVGMLEEDGGRIFNSAVLFGPDGMVGKYRKTHLPFLGVDKFTAYGGELNVFSTPVGRIGMEVCYDLTFPEASRALALQSAEILALPTNWPEGRERMPGYVLHTRALENRVYAVACDRVGEERGFRFIGKSKIVSPMGDAVAEGSVDEEELISARIDLALARNKRVVFQPNEFEVNLFGDRRPELYGAVAKHAPDQGLTNGRGDRVNEGTGTRQKPDAKRQSNARKG